MKLKRLEIENEKWKWKKILENSWETRILLVSGILWKSQPSKFCSHNASQVWWMRESENNVLVLLNQVISSSRDDQITSQALGWLDSLSPLKLELLGGGSDSGSRAAKDKPHLRGECHLKNFQNFPKTTRIAFYFQNVHASHQVLLKCLRLSYHQRRPASTRSWSWLHTAPDM